MLEEERNRLADLKSKKNKKEKVNSAKVKTLI